MFSVPSVDTRWAGAPNKLRQGRQQGTGLALSGVRLKNGRAEPATQAWVAASRTAQLLMSAPVPSQALRRSSSPNPMWVDGCKGWRIPSSGPPSSAAPPSAISRALLQHHLEPLSKRCSPSDSVQTYRIRQQAGLLPGGTHFHIQQEAPSSASGQSVSQEPKVSSREFG